jgi:hypothetical protein
MRDANKRIQAYQRQLDQADAEFGSPHRREARKKATGVDSYRAKDGIPLHGPGVV